MRSPITRKNTQKDAPVTYDDIERAASRLDGVARRTPVVSSRTVDARCGGLAHFKCENFQRTGAFKFRGAFNALSQLSEVQRKRGVLTYSSGNHAQAMALAGQILDIPVTVIMPHDAPAVKLNATRGYGATVVPYDRSETSRENLAHELSEERDLPIIPPYDHPHIVAGQGTAARELFQDIGSLDILLVCCGGGGLLSGSAISAKHLCPDCLVIGVEPQAGDDACRSFKTGTLQTVDNPDTIADGARTPSLGQITFPLVMEHVDDMVSVSDDEIRSAMAFIMQRMKLVVEPTGALAYAAVHSGRVDVSGKRVGVMISGGNLDLARLGELLPAAAYD